VNENQIISDSKLLKDIPRYVNIPQDGAALVPNLKDLWKRSRQQHWS